MQVRVWKIDVPAVMAQLRAWAERLCANDDRVLAVVLFGSLARGDATARSDADVLLLLEETDLPFDRRLVHYRPLGMPVPVEVFPYTRSEAGRMLREGWGMAVPAAREGVVLAEKDGAWSRLVAPA